MRTDHYPNQNLSLFPPHASSAARRTVFLDFRFSDFNHFTFDIDLSLTLTALELLSAGNVERNHLRNNGVDIQKQSSSCEKLCLMRLITGTGYIWSPWRRFTLKPDAEHHLTKLATRILTKLSQVPRTRASHCLWPTYNKRSPHVSVPEHKSLVQTVIVFMFYWIICQVEGKRPSWGCYLSAFLMLVQYLLVIFPPPDRHLYIYGCFLYRFIWGFCVMP